MFKLCPVLTLQTRSETRCANGIEGHVDHIHSPFTRSKALNSGSDRGVNQIDLIARLCRCRRLDRAGEEGEYGVHTAQSSSQLRDVVVICLDPSDSLSEILGGSVLLSSALTFASFASL